MILTSLVRDIAPLVGDDGMCQILIWKVGRSWHYQELWHYDKDYTNDPIWQDEYFDEVQSVASATNDDPNAVILSAYETFASQNQKHVRRQVIVNYYYNKYRYEIETCSDGIFSLRLFEDGKKAGVHTFSPEKDSQNENAAYFKALQAGEEWRISKVGRTRLN